jgi:hypothetical protein
MNLLRDYLVELTTAQIPMPKKWAETMGVYIEGNSQIDIGGGVVSTIETGYELFKTVLTRGVTSHVNNTTKLNVIRVLYLLQLFLLAERDINGVNMLPYLNLAQKIVSSSRENIFVFPVVIGELYTIYGDTQYPLILTIYYAHTNEVLARVAIPHLSSMVPYVLDTTDIKLLGITRLYTGEVEAENNKNIMEYIEAKLEAPVGVEVSVINGCYFPLGHAILRDALNPLAEEELNPLAEEELKPLALDGSIRLVPSLSHTHVLASEKLFSMLFGASINSNSSIELVSNVFSILSLSGDLNLLLPAYTRGIYDLDGNSDRRVL